MLDTFDLRLAERPTITAFTVGAEREPVVVIDGVMRDPQALVDLAATQLTFSEGGNGGSLYPGIGSPAPLDYARPLADAVDATIRQAFGIGSAPLIRARCRMSLITTAPEALLPLQRVPHIDTVDGMQFALLHYLCGEPFGGTAFFRHRATGYETVTPDRSANFRAIREREMKETPPPLAYCDGDSLYERIGGIEAKFNRLVIYRSCLLHSALVGDIAMLSEDPRHGRLTANLFLTYAAETRSPA